MEIMNHDKVIQKIKRMAFQIWEAHYDDAEIIIAGINTNGHLFAQLLSHYLDQISDLKIKSYRITLNPASPHNNPIEISPAGLPEGSHIIVTDDVANTGRTLFFACQPFLKSLPASLEAAVLVDRKHKAYPVKVDYMGLSLATTLKEHIDVILDGESCSAHLK
jgi:pyrimidine operon attenuation protein/uracil phosphoribosyltransferase